MAQTIAELNVIVTHPHFEVLIKEINDASDESRVATAERLATIGELHKRGIPVTDDFRISLRTFEGKNISPEFDNPTHEGMPAAPEARVITICLSVGQYVYVSVGTNFNIVIPDIEPSIP